MKKALLVSLCFVSLASQSQILNLTDTKILEAGEQACPLGHQLSIDVDSSGGASAGDICSKTNLFVNEGKVGVGTTSPLSAVSVVTNSHPIIRTSQEDLGTYKDNGRSSIGISTYWDAAPGSQLHLYKARGTGAAPTPILTEDEVGRVQWRGFNSTHFTNAGRIAVYATDDWSADQSASTMVFSTVSNGEQYLEENMRIIDGKVGIGTSTPASKLAVSGLPTSPPDASGNAGVVCVTNEGNFWLDNDGTNDCQ